MADGHPTWLDYVMGGTVLTAFAGYVGALRWLDIRMTLGLQLALLTTALGAVGGVGLVAFARRGVTAGRRRLLFLGVQVSVIVSPVLLLAPTVAHDGFRAAFFVCGAGVGLFGAVLMGTAVVGPDWRSSVDDAGAESP